MQTRSGIRLLYTLQDGETWAIYKGKLIVVHPERKPKIVHEDGSIEEIDPYDC